MKVTWSFLDLHLLSICWKPSIKSFSTLSKFCSRIPLKCPNIVIVKTITIFPFFPLHVIGQIQKSKISYIGNSFTRMCVFNVRNQRFSLMIFIFATYILSWLVAFTHNDFATYLIYELDIFFFFIFFFLYIHWNWILVQGMTFTRIDLFRKKFSFS